jgi:NTP pyrophosphatase (non-canonical NTP hydrolase)
MTRTNPETADSPSDTGVTLSSFQRLIRGMYYEKDVARGVPGTFMWLMEEIGELSTALRETSAGDLSALTPQELTARRSNLHEEFADVLAWLATIANVVDVDLDAAVQKKYGSGCPGCQQFMCVCPNAEKP